MYVLLKYFVVAPHLYSFLSSGESESEHKGKHFNTTLTHKPAWLSLRSNVLMVGNVCLLKSRLILK